mgnify:CR=1 FL=1
MSTRINTVDGLSALLAQQKQAFVAAGEVTAAERRDRIQQVIDMLVVSHKTLVEAIDADFGGRSPGFSLMNDVLGSLASLKYARDHFEAWMRPEVRTPFAPYDQLGAEAQVMYQPKGSVGIIGTWNAPLFTLLSPLACVLGAGNRAILKPSEITSHTAEAIAEAVSRHLDPEVVGVITGGPEIGAAFAAQPFDHLVFTGSTAVGRKIMRGASENLVPVTLELGGKSPAILSRSADLEESCRRIAMAKGTNGGQLCVSPDILYVPEERLEDTISLLKQKFVEFFPNIAKNPDVVPVVNEQHLKRVEGYIEEARASGARVEVTHDASEISDQNRRCPLSLVIGPNKDSRIMQEEIFGPALVILPYGDIASAVADINSRSNPLALYYYGADQEELDFVLKNTLSGGVTVNDALMHAAMHDAPFGGIGASGMGHYHGKEGFLEFSHMRTIFKAPDHDPRAEWGMLPPYYESFREIMESQVTSD